MKASSLERSVTRTRNGILTAKHLGVLPPDCKRLRGLVVDHEGRRRYIAPMVPIVEPLPILITPHPVLRMKARPVLHSHADELRALVPRMFETMYKAPGIGLAAPQVGIALRVFVMDLMPGDEPAPVTLINPEVVAASEALATREEGCLSVPGQYSDVTRPARVKIRYQDIEGVPRELEGEGLLAACLQHEIDHLDGILFVDHLTPLKRNMLLRRLAKDLKSKATE